LKEGKISEKEVEEEREKLLKLFFLKKRKDNKCN
jgi:hypothetical protein